MKYRNVTFSGKKVTDSQRFLKQYLSPILLYTVFPKWSKLPSSNRCEVSQVSATFPRNFLSISCQVSSNEKFKFNYFRAFLRISNLKLDEFGNYLLFPRKPHIQMAFTKASNLLPMLKRSSPSSHSCLAKLHLCKQAGTGPSRRHI